MNGTEIHGYSFREKRGGQLAVEGKYCQREQGGGKLEVAEDDVYRHGAQCGGRLVEADKADYMVQGAGHSQLPAEVEADIRDAVGMVQNRLHERCDGHS